ncbi:hypothetical protein MSAN_02308700 [Mycena sanguinolenta]|uniref:Uncharacterized protein n=1 Tax=Mycena sanguinolenta TaxID=230812 RepID=A0A8H7CHT6_9AGAR|nr:hypothetical protein MSAN_02308700 [Mycena sanguinolenta]
MPQPEVIRELYPLISIDKIFVHIARAPRDANVAHGQRNRITQSLYASGFFIAGSCKSDRGIAISLCSNTWSIRMGHWIEPRERLCLAVQAQSSPPYDCVFHVKVNFGASSIRRCADSPEKEHSHWRISFHPSSSKVNSLFFELPLELNVSLIPTVMPIKNCNALAVSLDICLVLSQTTTAMLFFIRVTAVWHSSKIAYVVFFILWLAVPSASITAPLGVRAAHILATTQCAVTAVGANVEFTSIMPLINDTAVFLAINYRILAHMIMEDSSTARFRVFLGGKGLSTLSQALLQTGQHFYLIAVTANGTVLVLLKLRPLSPLYHGMLAIPTMALVNAMACLVFRRIKLGLISPDGISKTHITGLSMEFHSTTDPRSSLHPRHTNPTTTEFGSSPTFPLDVRVQNEVDKWEGTADAGQEISKPTDLA